MKKVTVVLAMAVMLLVTVFVGEKDFVFGQEKYKTFGLLQALSGPAAPWGIPITRSIEMGADKINEQGGFKVQGQTYKWKTTSYDTKYVPAEAVKALNKAVYADKVDFVSIMGGSCVLASLPILKENKILSLNNSAADKNLANPNNNLVFFYNSSILGVYAATLPWLMEREGIKTMAAINPDDATGKSGLWSSKYVAEVNKLRIVSEEFFQRGTTDFAPLLTRVIAKKPDLIDSGYADPSSAALLCKQARELGYKGTILLIWGPDPNQVLKIAGDNAEGVYMSVTGPVEPETDSQKDLYKRFLAKYPKSEWSPMYYMHHAIIPCLTKAIMETQSFDSSVLANHLHKMTWDSPQGTFRFGGSKIYGIKTQLLDMTYILQVQKGKTVFLYHAKAPEGILD
jgi:branched-chain amino acid transport system substrate-binding protein